jgi:imidazole glycerol-phosphate synthase subunit HisH
MIGIVDYGLGNLGSIKNMIRKLGFSSVISSDPQIIAGASKLILPGVGAFDTGMRNLRDFGLLDVLHHKALVEKAPILGICLGAQLMTKSSEEGSSPGLGWFEAETVKFCFDGISGKWPLPNIGWRDVQGINSPYLLSGFTGVPRFYFVHSYFLRSAVADIVSMTANYGFDYSCGLNKDNLYCVQFHPEKSHKFGMQLLRKFLELY